MKSSATESHDALITTADHGILFEKCLESVRSQVGMTFSQVVIVDDSRHRPLCVEPLPNEIIMSGARCGQSAAINLGLRKATGHYVHLMDGDDQWAECKLRRVASAFSEHAVDVVSHNLTYFTFADGRELGTVRTGPSQSGPRSNIGPTSAMSFRRSALQSIGPIPESIQICSDQYLISLTNILGLRRIYLAESLGRYVLHGKNGFTGELTPDRLARRLAAFHSIRDSLSAIIGEDRFSGNRNDGMVRHAVRHMDREITRLIVQREKSVAGLIRALLDRAQNQNPIDTLYAATAELLSATRSAARKSQFRPNN